MQYCPNFHVKTWCMMINKFKFKIKKYLVIFIIILDINVITLNENLNGLTNIMIKFEFDHIPKELRNYL